MIDLADMFGRGFAFPPSVGPNGRVRFSSGPDNVRESIRIILLTEPGERVMLREFGAGLTRFLHQPNTVATHRQLEDAISRAIGRWEPRVEVEEVSVVGTPEDDQAALATVRYRLVANNFQDELRVRVQLAGT